MNRLYIVEGIGHMFRTDLACEARVLAERSCGRLTELEGVRARRETRAGFAVETVEILTEDGAAKLRRPRGRYVTVELTGMLRREDEAFRAGTAVLAEEIGKLLQLRPGDGVLVAGLGNEGITADALGPLTVRHTLVTRHLDREQASLLGLHRSVAAVETGVSGITGMESAELIAAVTAETKPDRVVAVDALASLSAGRICRTVQISDTGIIPGSGVGNARRAINRETLGVPVIALGVPTVVDAAALASELAGADPEEAERRLGRSLIVTPREIDEEVRSIGRLLGYALNLALHDGLTVDDAAVLLE